MTATAEPASYTASSHGFPLPVNYPMQSTEVAQPFHRDGWEHEEKYGGWRMLAYKDGDRVQLISRPGRDERVKRNYVRQ